MALSEFQKRKCALAFYRYDLSKDGVVEALDFDMAGQKLAELQGFEPGSLEYGKITSAFKTEWDTFLKPADQDGDDKLTLDEYIKLAEQLIEGPNATEINLSVNQHLFDIIDLDGDGTINTNEFVIFLKARAITEEEAKFAFSKLDVDNSGSISRKQFAKHLMDYYRSNDAAAPGNWFYGSY
ncbi:MAG: EF-hand domain-containing protein [Potamolinea sp.]